VGRRRAAVVDHPATKQKRTQALELILAGHHDVDIATALGVHRKTIYRWREDPEFAEELEERRTEMRDAVYARLMAMGDDAMTALGDMVRGVNAAGQAVKADMARVKAIQVWSELLGVHKNAPAAPVQRGSEVETEDQLRELLDQVPVGDLEEALARKRDKATKRKQLLEGAKPKPKPAPTKKL
jgi:hypothetical protein